MTCCTKTHHDITSKQNLHLRTNRVSPWWRLYNGGSKRHSSSACAAESKPRTVSLHRHGREQYDHIALTSWMPGCHCRPTMQKLIPTGRACTSFSQGSLPAGMLGPAVQAVRQSSLGVSASPVDPPPGWFAPRAPPPQRPAMEVNRSGSAPTRRLETAAEAAARRVSLACFLPDMWKPIEFRIPTCCHVTLKWAVVDAMLQHPKVYSAFGRRFQHPMR